MAGPEASTSSALVRKRTDTELMPPPPPAKRIQRPKTVLDEDSYTDGLSKIIARDFFPGLIESETQNEYLNALESKDPSWISSAGKRLKEAMTPGRRHRLRLPTPSLRGSLDGRPGETPQSFAGDTPASVVSVSTTATADTSVSAAKAKAGPNTNVSLRAYQTKYTSEDNESFYKLLDKQNQTRAEKHAWLYNGNKLPSKMQLKQKEVEDRLTKSGASLVDNGYKKDRLAIKDQGDRPAAPETWKIKAKNALMFLPDGMDGTVETVAQKTRAESLAAPKSIVYANTRLPGTSLLIEQRKQQQQQKGRRSSSVSSVSIPPSPTLSAVRDAIAGKPRRVDADSMAGSLAGSNMGGETPRVNGYTFVDDEEPEPEVDAPPVINFGKVDGTPNPFQLQDKSKREGLHHRMVERIAQSKRTSARVGMTGRATQTPQTPLPHSPRLSGGLTPAGQRLWSNMAGGSGGKPKDAISAFNRSKGGQQNNAKGSRRARLREIRSVLQ
jgi:protein DGCR14